MESSTTEAITTAAVLNPQQAYQGVSLPSITDRNQIVFEDDPPREEKSAPEWMSTIKQVMKIKTDRHFVLKKEENNSPNAEKNERLRGRNDRSTSKKKKAGGRGVGERKMAAPRPPDGGGRAVRPERLRPPRPARQGKQLLLAASRPPDGGERAIRPERLHPPRPARQWKAAAVAEGHKSPLPTLVPKGAKLS